MKYNYLHKHLSVTLSALLLSGSVLLAEDANNSNTKLKSVDVIAEQESNYINPDRINVNRTNITIDNTAKSIQIFNENFINDAHLQNIENIIEFSSNTVYVGNNHGRTSQISMRGFSSVPILIDGLKITNAVNSPEVFNFSAVEVQKGPDSLQYGQSSPGGIVNLVKKKPTKETLSKLDLEITDNPAYSAKVDLGGSLNKDQSLYFRLVSSLTNDEGFTNSTTDTNGIFIAPSIAYDINDNHTLTFITEYFDETSPSTFGNYVNIDGKIMGSAENTISNPDEEFNKTQKIIGFDLDSTFDTWNSNFKYRYVDYIYDAGDVHLPQSYDENTNIVSRAYAYQKQAYQEDALQYSLNKELKIANMRHNISTGIDYNKAYSKLDMQYDPFTPFNIDLLNPAYESLTTLADHPSAADYSGSKTYNKSWGAFIQDNINITDKVILNAGLRYSESKPKDGDKSDALSPSLGLIYNTSSNTKLYTSYSESFTPNTNTNSSGSLLDPEEGKGFEFGIKQKLFDDRFSLTAAVFKIKKVNVAIDDPDSDVWGVSIASGEQQSQGFEVDLQGNITSEISLVASYGYTTTKDIDNDNNDLVNIPNHTANLFTTYNLAKFNLPNLHIGGGARFIGSKYADTSNTIELDSVVIYNATIGYKIDNWQANLSVQNLTDEEYVDGAFSSNARGTRVYLGDPRTAVATLSYTF